MALQKPNQITVPFASSGLKNTIPETATGSNLASMQEGFPVITMTDTNDGGMPPQGQDMNGILFDVTKAIQYQQAGGLFPYDATFAQAIDGYPLGALLTSADGVTIYKNLVEGNRSNPDKGGQNWSVVADSSVLSGYLPLTGGTLKPTSGISTLNLDVADGRTWQNVTFRDENGIRIGFVRYEKTDTQTKITLAAGAVSDGSSGSGMSINHDSDDNIWVSLPSTPDSSSNNLYAATTAFVQNLLNNVGSRSVTATGSTASRGLSNRFSDIVNVLDFGAIGNGSTNDTTAIQDALTAGVAAGKSVFFPAGTYRITSPISISEPSGRVSIVSDSSTILLDSASSVQYVLGFSGIITNDIAIRGLRINANRNAYQGLYIRNIYNEDTPNASDILLEDVHVENVYRSDNDFSYGDGIYVEGGFRDVNIVRPVIKNCVMAAGAGASGTRGIFGISIIRNLSSIYNKHYSFSSCTIDSPYIENVYCEDIAYIDDQDAIRVFSSYTESLLNNASASIRNVFVKNVRGRTVKSQALNTNVDNVTIVNDVDPAGFVGILPNKSHVDLQVGGGNVNNINCLCSNAVCQSIVRMEIDSRTPSNNSLGNISNIKGILSGSPVATPMRAVLVGNSGSQTGKCVNVSNITIESDFEFNSCVATTGTNTDLSMNIVNCSAQLSGAIIRNNGGTSRYNVCNYVNQGAIAVPITVGSGITGNAVNLTNVSGA